MVKGGCTCPRWKTVLLQGGLSFDEVIAGCWVITRAYYIDFCPWCGSKLTDPPTEEDGNEAE